MLTGKTALITGGGRGHRGRHRGAPGRPGANVAVLYAGQPGEGGGPLRPVRPGPRGQAQAYQCDVADFAAAKAVVAQVKKDFGTVDILVNNAGITRDGLLAMLKEESFDRVLDVDLKGAFNFIRHCTPSSSGRRAGPL